MRCEQHPNYKGKQPPKVDCQACRQLYIENDPILAEYTRGVEQEADYWQKLAATLQKSANKTQRIIDGMRGAAQAISVPKRYSVPRRKTKFSDEHMVILLSDCQAGTEVIGREVGHPSWDYNINIWRYRMRVFMRGITEVLSRHRQSYNVPNGSVWLGGDLLEGETIFKPQQAFIDTNVQNQFFIVLYEMAQWLTELSRQFDKLDVYCTPGNHGRIGSTKELNDWVNWEYILYRMLQVILAGHKSINVVVPDSFWQTQDINGTNFLFIHGEDIRRWMEFPWYASKKFYHQYMEMTRKLAPFDVFVFGHHHQPMNLQMPDGEMFCNGSFVGFTRYVVKRLGGIGIPPKQWVMFVHPRHQVTARYKIKLDHEYSDIELPEIDIKTPVPHEDFEKLLK